MDWYTPDPNVKVSLEITRDALQVLVLEFLIRSFEQLQAQISRCRNKKLSSRR